MPARLFPIQVSFFFEEKAFDEEGRLTIDKNRAINKIGHGALLRCAGLGCLAWHRAVQRRVTLSCLLQCQAEYSGCTAICPPHPPQPCTTWTPCSGAGPAPQRWQR